MNAVPLTTHLVLLALPLVVCAGALVAYFRGSRRDR